MGKIDLSKLTGALKGLGTLRTYSALIWPVAITLIGVGVLGASILMGNSFRARVSKQSIPMANEVKSLSSSAVPQGQVEVERQYQQRFSQDANLIERMVLQTTQRELLTPEVRRVRRTRALQLPFHGIPSFATIDPEKRIRVCRTTVGVADAVWS